MLHDNGFPNSVQINACLIVRDAVAYRQHSSICSCTHGLSLKPQNLGHRARVVIWELQIPIPASVSCIRIEPLARQSTRR